MVDIDLEGIAAQVWNVFDRAKLYVATEANALCAALFLAGLPPEETERLSALIDRHIDTSLKEDWPAMAQPRATLATPPMAFIEVLNMVLARQVTLKTRA